MAGRLNQRLKMTHPALPVIDEIGYLPVTHSGAILFFQLVNRRYEHASTVLTPNQSFERWDEILHDEVMAAALLDRLLHRCHIVNIRGNSTGCAVTPNSPRRSIRRPPGPCQLSGSAMEEAPCERPLPSPGPPRSGRYAPSARRAQCVRFSMARSVRFSVAVDTEYRDSIRRPP